MALKAASMPLGGLSAAGTGARGGGALVQPLSRSLAGSLAPPQRMWQRQQQQGTRSTWAAVGSVAAFCTAGSSSAAACKEKRPKIITVYYGDLPFWRAECVRMSLFIGGVAFEDKRDQKRDELKAEGKLAFGATPVMEVDGKMLSQTQAMAAFAGRLSGLYPGDDAWLAAKVDEAINGCTDITTTIGGTMRLPADDKVKAREALIAPEGRLTMHLGGLERLISENGHPGFVVGSSITVADLAIWRLVGWVSSGVIDGIPMDYVAKTFPQIEGLCEQVDAHPKVQEWKAKYDKFYGKK